LGFERLTCVPIQMKMVKESMLTKEEKAWLKVRLLFS
jgi:Xaa-Pro aminopeptidase